MKRSKLFPGIKVSKNPGLFFVEYWKRDQDEPGWTLDSMRSGGSATWAKLCAKDQLRSAKVVATKYTYYRDMGRADYCVVRCPDGSMFSVEPDCDIVPSVGELGYW